MPDIIPTSIDEILALSPAALLVAGLNILGFIISNIKKLPNEFIPFIILAAGTLIFPQISNINQVPYSCKNPELILYLQGFAFGGLAVGLHQAGRQLKSWLNKNKNKTDEQ